MMAEKTKMIGVYGSREWSALLSRLAEVDHARVVGPSDPGGQGPIAAGEVAVDVVADRPGELVRGEVKGQHAILLGVLAGRGLDRAVDHRRAGGHALLDHQEVALVSVLM